MDGTMRAAIYGGKGNVSVETLPLPGIGADDVLIENLHAGVCGSDVSAFLHGPQAHRITIGSEFGHEMVSRIAQVGAHVTGFRVGERVYPYPLLARGDRSRAGTLGGFSQYIRVPDPTPGVELYPVPDVISDRAAALIEPFTVAFHAARQAEPSPGDTAVVWGAGTIGIGAALGLRHLGAARVLVADLSDFRLRKAAELGFDTVNPSREELRTAATRLFGTAPSVGGETADVDIFVEATGADALIGQFQEIGKLRSRLVVVGVHASPVPVDFAALAYSSHRIAGSGGYEPGDVRDVIAFLRDHGSQAEAIITHEFPLEDIVTALETASDPQSALNVAIVHEAARRA